MWKERTTEKNETFDAEADKEKRIIREFLSTNILDTEIRNILHNVKDERDLWGLYRLLMFREKLVTKIKEKSNK
ncbi:MAG: hypothetical protein ACO2PO_11110 [Candidatus Calescibacterium sp.]